MAFSFWDQITFQGTFNIKPGMRWDQVSTACYGSPNFTHTLIWANSGILSDDQKRSSQIETSITIQVPLLDFNATYQDDLTEWRRGS